MAGNGPAPADKSERRRRNKPARGEWVDLEPLEAPSLPELPPCPLRHPDTGEPENWSDRAKAAWQAWREDPVTQYYTPADIAYIKDLLLLYETMRSTTANEVRLRMDGLGLTPKGKKDLRYRIPDPGEAGEKPRQRRAASKAGSERRGRLSVVK